MKKISVKSKDGPDCEFLIDDEDFDEVSKHQWCLRQKHIYTSRIGSLHRFLMQSQPGVVVHHKDMNPLNHQKNNLVEITATQHWLLHFPEKAARFYWRISQPRIQHPAPENVVIPPSPVKNPPKSRVARKTDGRQGSQCSLKQHLLQLIAAGIYKIAPYEKDSTDDLAKARL